MKPRMNNTERFSQRARDYVAGRPSYPREAIDALFDGLGDPASLTAVDLGAGTGISSRLLAGRGAFVYAVEPNQAMRESAEGDPNVAWVPCGAESTSLRSGVADLVVAFQAFHWFAYDTALPEMQRLLRPSGRCAVVYNERDEDDPFTAAYGDIVRRFATDDTEAGRQRARTAFAAYSGWKTTHTFEARNVQELDRAGLHARARSTSYLPQNGSRGEKLHAAIDALWDDFAAGPSRQIHLKTIVIATAPADVL